MKTTQPRIPVQESLLFMVILTAVGGYMNAYSFLTHGAFTSLHTGNMVNLGMNLFQGRWSAISGVLFPIIGNITGAFLAELLKRTQSGCTKRTWQRSTIAIELVVLGVIALLPQAIPDALANWFLSVTAGFQLSNFRSCEGTAHNTTICTGNLRTIGQFLCAAVLTRKSQDVVKLLRYVLVVVAFPVGAGLGAVLTLRLANYAAWVCCAGLAVMLWMLRHPEPEAAAA